MASGASSKKPKKKGSGIRLWAVLTGLFTVLMVALLVAAPIAEQYSTVINLYLKAPTTKVVKGDDAGVDTQYFKSDFSSPDELAAHEQQVAEQVEGEGAVLLVNRDDTLPLASGSSVSTVSHSSVDLIYGGTGSGAVDTSTAPTLKSALTDAGLSVNPTLWDFYTSDEVKAKYTRVIPTNMLGTDASEATVDYAANEVPWDEVSTAAGDSFATYGDAAIFVVSRSGGEGADLPNGQSNEGVVTTTTGSEGNYLALSQTERDNLEGLKALKDDGTIDKIIVLLNSSNALQADFLYPEVCGVDYGIDAALWIGDVGQMGINAVADILVGNVNPSGRLVDTYVYDSTSAPSMQNFYSAAWGGAKEAGLTRDAYDNYLVYQEGIYVGYRYYETRYEDAVMGTGNAGDYDYASTVAFPFGYGLSYTDFAYSNYTVSESADAFTVSVDVTNTGDVAGKHTVQVFFQSPYTDYDRANGVEKASVELCGYDKTGLLEPGQSQTVTVKVPKSELVAYDANGAQTYILDAGDYYLTVAGNAHEALNNILAAKGFSPESTAGVMDAAGNATLAHAWNNPALDITTYSTSAATGAKITNLFDAADPNKNPDSPGAVTWLSRSDWAGTMPTQMVLGWDATQTVVDNLADRRYQSGASAQMPTLGADNGKTLAQMIGKDYDDPEWDSLLDQLTTDDMVKLISLGFHSTAVTPSVSKPATKDENGPTGLTASLIKGDSAMCYPSEDIMAATFNDDLIEEMGRCIGEDCLAAGYSGLYGPAANIHRSPYGGRNFEYYSEDPFVSGQICASEIKGIQSKGTYVYLKHFALNDSETNRIGLSTWTNEQAAREIYLKAFEAPIVDGKASGVMSAFTRWGYQWAGATRALQTDLLRGEWGMVGMSLTDFSGYASYMDIIDGLQAGSDIWDNSIEKIHTNNLKAYAEDPVIVNSMREASHRVLYVVANSNGMNGYGPNDLIQNVDPWWLTAAHVVTGAFGVCAVGSAVMLVRRVRSRNVAKAAAK